MRSLLLSLSLLLMTTLATPALAVTPTAGDVFEIVPGSQGQLVHWDVETGESTLVSCWNPSVCSPVIGSGPPFDDQILSGSELTIGPDGGLFLRAGVDSQVSLFRIDPHSGDRTLYAPTESSSGFAGFVVWPAPNFFPATVASIGGWGAALLVSGIFIGVQLRMKKTAEA